MLLRLEADFIEARRTDGERDAAFLPEHQVTWTSYQKLVSRLVKQLLPLREDLDVRAHSWIIVGIARGGPPLAVSLSHGLNCRLLGVASVWKYRSSLPAHHPRTAPWWRDFTCRRVTLDDPACRRRGCQRRCVQRCARRRPIPLRQSPSDNRGLVAARHLAGSGSSWGRRLWSKHRPDHRLVATALGSDRHRRQSSKKHARRLILEPVALKPSTMFK